MQEDHIRSFFQIEYTRWLLTTLVGLILFLFLEICLYLKININSLKSSIVEAIGGILIMISFLFAIKYPNLISNLFLKNKLKMEKEKNRRLLTKIKELSKKCKHCKFNRNINQ